MMIVLVVSLLVAGTLASTVPESSGYGKTDYGSPGYGSPGYGRVGYFLDSDVSAATDFAISVRNELNFLNTRLEVFLEDEKSTLSTLDNVIQNVIPHFIAVQEHQDDRLENIKRQLRIENASVRKLLSQLDGEEAIANQINDGLTDLTDRIALLVRTNRNQNASLISIETELYAAKDMLHNSLTDMESTAEDQINQLATDVHATIELINTRHCFTTVVHVDVEEQTSEGEGEVDIPIDLFDGAVPIPFCVLQGFHTKLNLGQSYSYGAYGSHHDRRRNVAIIVDCYAIGDSVTVRVFDQSRGNINRVTGAYVAVKTCSFGPKAVVAKH